jgi:hypothetical protein
MYKVVAKKGIEVSTPIQVSTFRRTDGGTL